jgi:hypothetical protein
MAEGEIAFLDRWRDVLAGNEISSKHRRNWQSPSDFGRVLRT